MASEHAVSDWSLYTNKMLQVNNQCCVMSVMCGIITGCAQFSMCGSTLEFPYDAQDFPHDVCAQEFPLDVGIYIADSAITFLL